MEKELDIKKYLKNPDVCPFCDSGNISAEEADFSFVYAWRKVSCNSCNKRWKEEFTITKAYYEE